MPRAWHLTSRPKGLPTQDNFALREVALPPLGEGMVRVANRWLSVDPYMRGRMNDVKSYVPPFALGEPLDGRAVGEVVASASEDVAVGDMVVHQLGWREHAVLGARHVRVVDTSRVPASALRALCPTARFARTTTSGSAHGASRPPSPRLVHGRPE